MKKVRSKLRPTEIGVIKTFSLSPDDEIGAIAVECTGATYYYDSLAELCEKWEDVSEEEVWYLGKRIGNYSIPKKEADIVTEKILAWKRLKNKGFKFDGYDVAHKSNGNLAGQIFYDAGNYSIEDVEKEMDLIFGGEE